MLCIQIHVRACVRACMCLCVCVCWCLCVCSRARARVSTMHTHTHTHTHTHVPVHVPSRLQMLAKAPVRTVLHSLPASAPHNNNNIFNETDEFEDSRAKRPRCVKCKRTRTSTRAHTHPLERAPTYLRCDGQCAYTRPSPCIARMTCTQATTFPFIFCIQQLYNERY